MIGTIILGRDVGVYMGGEGLAVDVVQVFKYLVELHYFFLYFAHRPLLLDYPRDVIKSEVVSLVVHVNALL